MCGTTGTADRDALVRAAALAAIADAAPCIWRLATILSTLPTEAPVVEPGTVSTDCVLRPDTAFLLQVFYGVASRCSFRPISTTDRELLCSSYCAIKKLFGDLDNASNPLSRLDCRSAACLYLGFIAIVLHFAAAQPARDGRVWIF